MTLPNQTLSALKTAGGNNGKQGTNSNGGKIYGTIKFTL